MVFLKDMLTFRTMIHEAAHFLERNHVCKKHHVKHTGSSAYILDFYSYLDEVEKGKFFLFELLERIIETKEGGWVFYPGHLDPMNMSQNVIDTGTAVDAIARFAYKHKESFSTKEHEKIQEQLSLVVDSYLDEAAGSKKITNQRLWGLTGIAGYAKYMGKEEEYKKTALQSINKAFLDSTKDGFFRYFPDPETHSLPYDDITTFYQSRHSAFIQYALMALFGDEPLYKKEIEKSIEALLSMYTIDGVKDMRMECKRWYWLSSYEVASHAFDAYAFSQSTHSLAETLFHNVLYQIRSHFFEGYLHSHKGVNNNFQCPIFWTAHLAWLTRIEGIEESFNNASHLKKFSFIFKGEEVYTSVSENGDRVLINSRYQKRNPTTGIYDNGLVGESMWDFKIPSPPHAYFFSLREVLNHSWYALRGFRILESFLRLGSFMVETVVALIPFYSTRYGRVVSLKYEKEEVFVKACFGSKYGTLLSKEKIIDYKL